MATKTRFDELRFHQPFPGVWRFVDAEDRDVGPQYATRAELLADLDRYAAEYGCVGAVDVNATLRARVAELEAALQGMLDAASLTPGDCYTDGMPNANWGAIDRAKATARAALGAKGEGT